MARKPLKEPSPNQLYWNLTCRERERYEELMAYKKGGGFPPEWTYRQVAAAEQRIVRLTYKARRDDKRLKQPKPKCRCRPARGHRDCAYCGLGWYRDGWVCGLCSENGIDGKVIPGTSRVVCRLHKGG
jgi:hypothetical protein